MSKYKNYYDRDLLSLIKENSDHYAYGEIFERYSALLYSHAYNKLRNQEEAEDVVQDTFSKFWIKRQELDLNQSFPNYLFVLVRHQIIDIIRRRYISSAYQDHVFNIPERGYVHTDFLLREKQLNDLIEREIGFLPPRMRQVFELRRNNHLSNKEIAIEMGISEATVADQMKKALKSLRVKLKWAFIFIF